MKNNLKFFPFFSLLSPSPLWNELWAVAAVSAMTSALNSTTAVLTQGKVWIYIYSLFVWIVVLVHFMMLSMVILPPLLLRSYRFDSLKKKNKKKKKNLVNCTLLTIVWFNPRSCSIWVLLEYPIYTRVGVYKLFSIYTRGRKEKKKKRYTRSQ